MPIRRLSLLLLLTSVPALAERNAAAQAAFDRGGRALAEGRFPDAQSAYQEALTLSPGDGESENGLGSALFKLGKPDEAVVHFKAALQSSPDLKPAWFNLAFVQRKVGDYTGAAASYERYIQLAPNEADGFYGLAESQRLSGRKVEAISAYEKYLSLEKRPGQEKLRNRATEQLAALKAEPAAVVAVAPAAPVETTPTDRPQAPGLKGIGSAGVNAAGAGAGAAAGTAAAGTAAAGSAAAGTAAAGTVAAGSAAAGSAAAGSAAAGTAPGALGLGGPAVRDAQPTPPPNLTAAVPAPTNPGLAKDKVAEGDTLYAQKRFREASFAYQDAVNADGNDVVALFKLGRSYAVLGYLQQAIDRWRRVVLLAQDPAIRKSAEDQIKKAEAKISAEGGANPQAQGLPAGAGPNGESARAAAVRLYEDGVKRVMSRDYGGALDSLTQAIKFEPNLSVVWIARGSAQIGLRRYVDAIADYQQALRLDPNRASPLYGLAEAHTGLRRGTEARTYYQRYAASTAPDVQPSLQADARRKADQMR